MTKLRKLGAHPLIVLALVAGMAMCVQDLTATGMVIAESRFNAPVAALLDQLQWMAGIVATVLGVADVIRERRVTKRAVVAFFAISAGNIIGTFAGVVYLGHVVSHH